MLRASILGESKESMSYFWKIWRISALIGG
jgi:hypothetical protein